MHIVIIIVIVCGIAGAAILSRQNSAGTGCLLGLFLGPIGVLISILSSLSNKTSGTVVEITETRVESKCPFCAEWILKEAKICKHCGKTVI